MRANPCALPPRIALLPAAVLRLYRKRVDGQAKKWLRQGTEQHDRQALCRIVDEHFCSSVGDRALLCGDLAFERGNFDEALHWWLLLTAPPSEVGRPAVGLRFPDPQVDLAAVRARQILAWLFLRLPQRVAEELAAFRKLHAKAQGTIAGKTGAYVDLLGQLIADARKDLLAAEADWPTFGGSATRNRVLVRPPRPQLWRSGPTWSVPLVGASPALSRRPVVHPIIVDDQVLVAGACAVRAFRLTDGAPLFQFDLSSVADRIGFEPALKKSAVCGGGCTLSASDDSIFARLGAPLPCRAARDAAPMLQHQSFLICLDRTPPIGPEKPPRVRWQVKADGLPGLVGFEGAPLPHGDRVYVALMPWLASARGRNCSACGPTPARKFGGRTCASRRSPRRTRRRCAGTIW